MTSSPRAWRLVLLVLVTATAAHAEVREVLRVGTSDDYAPFSKAGEGFDVDVARAFASHLGYRIEWVPFRWPDLSRDAAAGRFDVAMSGITWRARRSVVGYLTRAVAAGGPCVLQSKPPGRVGVNRGGILERYARSRFSGNAITAVDDNDALPRLLAAGEVDAIVTDTFELPHFARAGWTSSCEPPRDRKVYWVTPERAAELGPRFDNWIRGHEPLLQKLREKWMGASTERTDVDHLVDLLGRRLGLMPHVAAYKRIHTLPIEDRAREAEVLAAMNARAVTRGVPSRGLQGLFRVQIELAKAIQRRTPGGVEPLDLARIRKTLLTLGDRILDALQHASRWPPIVTADLKILETRLAPGEIAELRDALRKVQGLASSPSP